MLNLKNLKHPICTKWKELCKIDFNAYIAETDKKRSILFNDFSEKVSLSLKQKNVVVNGGHFIPNSDDYEDIGENSIKTWTLACQLVKKLKDSKINAKISLIINDIGLTNESRKIIFDNHIKLPEKYIEHMYNNGLNKTDIQHCGWNNDSIYSQKKLSNRIEHMIRRRKINQKYEEVHDYCVSALIMYYLDLIEQEMDVSFFISPKCAWLNLKSSIDLFQKTSKSKLIHRFYFETNNCL